MGADASTARQQLLDRIYGLGFDYEAKYGSCPQCVLAALQAEFPFIDDALFKASHPLSGGGALASTGTCGALSGAMLAIGARHGRDRASFMSTRSPVSAGLAKKVHDRFVAEFGSPVCAEIHRNIMGRTYDLWNDADRLAFDADGGHRDKCPDVVGKAARIAAEVLLEAEGR